MTDKLAQIAKREEELRKLNDQLTEKQHQIESEVPFKHDELNEESDNEDAGNENDYMNNVESDIEDDKEDDKEQNKNAAKENEYEDKEFEKNLLEVKKYQEVVEKCTKYERTIALQKAKIETLELELQNSISNMNTKDLQISELESKDKSLSDQSKKYTTQINQLNLSIQKLKKQNEDYYNKIEELEKAFAQQRQDINKNSQAQVKATQESHNKDIK